MVRFVRCDVVVFSVWLDTRSAGICDELIRKLGSKYAVCRMLHCSFTNTEERRKVCACVCGGAGGGEKKIKPKGGELEMAKRRRRVAR